MDDGSYSIAPAAAAADDSCCTVLIHLSAHTILETIYNIVAPSLSLLRMHALHKVGYISAAGDDLYVIVLSMLSSTALHCYGRTPANIR